MDEPLRTPPPTPSRRNKHRKRIVNYFFVFSSSLISETDDQPEKRIIRAVKKFGPPSSSGDEIDENSVALLCLPDGITVLNSPSDPKFHFFVITKQDGTRIYGSALLTWEKQKEVQHHVNRGYDYVAEGTMNPVTRETKYVTKAYCLLTTFPFVLAAKKLLLYFWKCNCDPNLVETVCNLKLPNKGKCIKLRLPPLDNASIHYLANQFDLNNTNITMAATSTSVYGQQVRDLTKIHVYRGITELPLFDHPLRVLFLDVLSPILFFKALTALLLEFQVLVTSDDYYKLVLVAESLTSLLLPFKWQHVYVPILPPKLGLHYLDAPTPYIMGIKASPMHNSDSSHSPSLSSVGHSIQCRISCDANKVEFLNENSKTASNPLHFIPPFLNELAEEINDTISLDVRLMSYASEARNNKNKALKRVVQIAKKHNITNGDDFSYLDDLKFNQRVRIACVKAMKKHILRDFEKFIVNAHRPSRDSIKFDVVSYLCDQPEPMKPFLSKFLETQMFASFIDEAATKMRKAKQSLFSSRQSLMTSSGLTTSVISNSPDLIIETSQENRALDELSSFDDEHLETVFECAHDVDLSENKLGATTCKGTGPSTLLVKVTSSPVRQRMKLQQQQLQLQHTNQINTKKLPELNGIINSQNELTSPCVESQVITTSPAHLPSALAAHTNWRVVECLLREAKLKTKRILLSKMGNDEVAPLGCGSIGEQDENMLIASLCDLVERVWSHGMKSETNCAFWSHLVAFARLEASVTGNKAEQRTRNGDSNYLTPAVAWVFLRKRIDSLSNMSLDAPSKSRSAPASPSRASYDPMCHGSSSNNDQFKNMPNSLLYDFRSVQMMTDVKTDLGKSRAFIRLALERKLLSKHLRTLLSNHELLVSMYKRYAFLRSEEEREQFITHLLTLSAVDLHCFTNTFSLYKSKPTHCIWRKKWLYKSDYD